MSNILTCDHCIKPIKKDEPYFRLQKLHVGKETYYKDIHQRCIQDWLSTQKIKPNPPQPNYPTTSGGVIEVDPTKHNWYYTTQMSSSNITYSCPHGRSSWYQCPYCTGVSGAH